MGEGKVQMFVHCTPVCAVLHFGYLSPGLTLPSWIDELNVRSRLLHSNLITWFLCSRSERGEDGGRRCCTWYQTTYDDLQGEHGLGVRGYCGDDWDASTDVEMHCHTLGCP